MLATKNRSLKRRMQPLRSALDVASVDQKLSSLEDSIHLALLGQLQHIPEVPARDVEVREIKALPDKPGLSRREGQARMLHDLASIEMQAMELGLRTLMEFPEAPMDFRDQLAQITREEAKHLGLCVREIRELGMEWGDFPVHIGLWKSVSREDSLIDRILIVHRYLEGSGLDAGDKLLRRLSGVAARGPQKVAEVIQHDELAHVQFGSDWYKKICRIHRLDPDSDFAPRLRSLFHRLPRRIEPIHHELRMKSGFSREEIAILEDFRSLWLAPPTEKIHQNLKQADTAVDRV